MPEVSECIRRDILEGRLPFGERLTENHLAERYGVSRTPIREALRQVERDGLIERTPGGMFVRERSAEEIYDIFEIRVTLESLAARRAALKRSEVDLVRLRSLQQQAQALDGTADPVKRRNLSRDFHEAVWATGRNAELATILSALYDRMAQHKSTTLDSPGRWLQATSEHAALIEAIAAQDPDSASALTETHITNARNVRLGMND